MAGAIPNVGMVPAWAPGGIPSWSPAPDYTSPSAGTGAPVAHHTVNHNTFHIKSTDPAGAAKEVTREQARNAQSKVKM